MEYTNLTGPDAVRVYSSNGNAGELVSTFLSVAAMGWVTSISVPLPDKNRSANKPITANTNSPWIIRLSMEPVT
jgi:hypothetical protein